MVFPSQDTVFRSKTVGLQAGSALLERLPELEEMLEAQGKSLGKSFLYILSGNYVPEDTARQGSVDIGSRASSEPPNCIAQT